MSRDKSKTSADDSHARKMKKLEQQRKLERELRQATKTDVLGLAKLYKISIRIYILLLSIAVAMIFLDRSAGLALLYAIGQIVVGALQIIGIL